MTKKKSDVDKLLIGAHTSIAGGLHNALIQGKAIGATTVQIFTANQRQWKAKEISEEAVELFQATLEETGLSSIMSHASYLINLGSADPEILTKSRKAFNEEIERSLALGLSFVNFHPGAATSGSRERCLDCIVESLCGYQDLFDDDGMRLLLESTAGQGTTVGTTFEELAYILERTAHKLPMGVCIDTCHLFASGYDIRTKQDWQKLLSEFDQKIGLKHLSAIHVNDSVAGLGSRKDRHASLGEGQIGIDSFRYMMQASELASVPKYLETPEGPAVWDKEIWMLREFALNPTPAGH